MNQPLAHPLAVDRPEFAPERADHAARFTAAEFLRMATAGAFDDMKVELIAGRLERMNPPMNDHGAGQAQVLIRLAGVLDAALLRGETAVRLDERTVLGFDAGVLRAAVVENRALEPGDLLLAVEIASTTLARDTGEKRLAYAAAGLAHYWVIDVERRVTHVYGDPVAGDYAEVSTVRFGQPLAVPGTERTILLG